MNVELMQLLYYAGFAVLGWWLRHRGILGPRPAPNGGAGPAPTGTVDQKVLIDLLKGLLDRLVQAPAPPAPGQPNAPGHVITVPFEVAATPKVNG
jgi:hypothetical protein